MNEFMFLIVVNNNHFKKRARPIVQNPFRLETTTGILCEVVGNNIKHSSEISLHALSWDGPLLPKYNIWDRY